MRIWPEVAQIEGINGDYPIRIKTLTFYFSKKDKRSEIMIAMISPQEKSSSVEINVANHR